MKQFTQKLKDGQIVGKDTVKRIIDKLYLINTLNLIICI